MAARFGGCDLDAHRRVGCGEGMGLRRRMVRTVKSGDGCGIGRSGQDLPMCEDNIGNVD